MPLAEVAKAEVHLVGDIVLDAGRHGDAAGLGNLLQARGNVHAVAEDVVAVDHHVADMHAHAEVHARAVRLGGVSLRHLALHADGGGHGVHDRGELGQKPVARRLDDAPAVHADHRRQRVEMPFQRAHRPVLIAADERAEARHVGGEDGGETAIQRVCLRATGEP